MMVEDFSDPQKTVQLLDQLCKQGFTEQQFRSIHGGSGETIAKHRAYCLRTSRFQPSSRNWQVQKQLSCVADNLEQQQQMVSAAPEKAAANTAEPELSADVGIYMAYPTTVDLKKTDKRLFCRSRVNSSHTKIGKFERGADRRERDYRATFDGEIEFQVVATVSAESIREGEMAVLRAVRSQYATVERTLEWFNTDDREELAKIIRGALEQSGISFQWQLAAPAVVRQPVNAHSPNKAIETNEPKTKPKKTVAKDDKPEEGDQYPKFYRDLKDYQDQHGHEFRDDVILRTHRALSWLNRAEKEVEDHDARFVFLWISFNALYGREIPDRRDTTERKIYKTFLQRLNQSDKKHLLEKLVSGYYRETIEALIDHQYVFQPYWDFLAGRISEDQWEKRFIADTQVAQKALKSANAYKVLEITLDRLYVLRNQVMHGNATWRGSVNRSQVEAGAKILSYLVPVFILIVLNNPDKDWGEPSFKVQV